MVPFDACFDLTRRMLPDAAVPEAAVGRVRTAVEALPGAGWISVAWCGDAPGEGRWLRVFPAGGGGKQHEGAWAELRERIAAVARQALDPDATP